MKALDKKRILAPSDYFYHFSFPRYGRFKSKFLCERYSHCIYSSCSIELTKTANTWSLTAVSATFYWWLQNKIHKLAANAALTQAPPYTSRSSSWLESLKHTQSCLQSVLPVGGPFAILRDREMLGRVRPILTPPSNSPYVPALASTNLIQLKQLKKK